MALNKLMHPRNPYRERKPNFKELAKKYEKFEQHVTEDDRGNFHIDFKKPECLRALTWALLKDDFDLDVLMPLDRLIPTVPLRLNYILWIEDIIKKSEDVKAIDIGAGASCIYGLLGARKNSWNFTSTEADATNCEYAKKNVTENGLNDKVSVVKVSEETILYDLLSNNDDTYDFCMCNPPFFGSNFEAWGMLTSRNDDRPEPSSVSTASPAESIVPGGEVDFVKRMVVDSLTLKERVRVYTTMLGKKSSVSVIKEDLKRNGITNIGQTEFCQGKTMRWGIGWSFDATVEFPKPPSKLYRTEKPKPPISYVIPQGAESLKGVEYTLRGITDKVIGIIQDLQIKQMTIKHTAKERTFNLTAKKNTWSHQRRKRRQQKQQGEGTSESEQHTTIKPSTTTPGSVPPEKDKSSEPSPKKNPESDQNPAVNSSAVLTQGSEQMELGISGSSGNSKESPQDEMLQVNSEKTERPKRSLGDMDDSGIVASPSNEEVPSKKCKIDTEDNIVDPEEDGGDENTVKDEKEAGSVKVKEAEDDDPVCLMKCVMGLKVQSKTEIVLQMTWVEGEQKESMHQVMQYLKNSLC